MSSYQLLKEGRERKALRILANGTGNGGEEEQGTVVLFYSLCKIPDFVWPKTKSAQKTFWVSVLQNPSLLRQVDRTSKKKYDYLRFETKHIFLSEKN